MLRSVAQVGFEYASRGGLRRVDYAGSVPATKKPETKLGLTRRARRMVRVLAEGYPDAHCELDFTTPLELIVAVVLSAQCTDKKVNEVTPALFAKYPTAADYAGADRVELEEMIRPTGFYRNKATSLMGLGAALVERHDGVVPGKLEELVKLPGVGRKTANVVLGNAFDVPGITVDTHFGRLVRRWGWTDLEDAVKVEQRNPGRFELPSWDLVSQKKVRDALNVLADTLPDKNRMFGAKNSVDPVRHLLGATSGWISNGSPTRSPTVIRGFSEVYGSCMTSWICRRSRRSSAPRCSKMFCPR